MNANLQTALEWLEMGVSPIPVVSRSKIPAIDWKMWQERTPPRKVVDYWFGDSSLNVGVICGGKKNLAIIDFDNIHSYYDWRKDTLRIDAYRDLVLRSYRVRTPRGMHIYAKTMRRENSRKYPETSIDVRCHANYTLVPPSIHPSGMRYEPIGNPDMIVAVESLEQLFPDSFKNAREIVAPDTRCPGDMFEQGARVNTIADIKDSVSILKFVSQLTSVHRTSANGRWWMARCISPTHKDRHPSFRIDTLRNRAKCMSTGCILYHDIGYDVVDLYMLIHGITRSQAVREMIENYL